MSAEGTQVQQIAPTNMLDMLRQRTPEPQVVPLGMPVMPGTAPGAASPAPPATARAAPTIPGPPPVPPGAPQPAAGVQASTQTDAAGGQGGLDSYADPGFLASLAGAVLYGIFGRNLHQQNLGMGAPMPPGRMTDVGADPALPAPGRAAFEADKAPLAIGKDPGTQSVQPGFDATTPKASVGDMTIEGLNTRTPAPTPAGSGGQSANDAATAVRAQLQQKGINFADLGPAWRQQLSDPAFLQDLVSNPAKMEEFVRTLSSMRQNVRVKAVSDAKRAAKP